MLHAGYPIFVQGNYISSRGAKALPVLPVSPRVSYRHGNIIGIIIIFIASPSRYRCRALPPLKFVTFVSVGTSVPDFSPSRRAPKVELDRQRGKTRMQRAALLALNGWEVILSCACPRIKSRGGNIGHWLSLRSTLANWEYARSYRVFIHLV